MQNTNNKCCISGRQKLRDYTERAETLLSGVFRKAWEKNELHFALSLNPEFRGCQDIGWNTANESVIAFKEYGCGGQTGMALS